MVEAGAAAETEVTRAESGVADRLEGIIVADNAVRQRERDLKRILNRPDIAMDSPTIVVPASKPNPLYYRLDARQLVRVAINQRMDMLETELQIALEAANVRSARNAMLPLVTLDYAYNISGLGPDLGDSLRMTRDKDYEDHRLGVRMEVPIGNEAARSRLRASLARRMQQIATKQQRATLVEQEVLNAIDQIEANYQRIWAAQKRVLMSTRVVDLETRHFTQGLRTSTDVLDAQTKLANAQLSEVSAITEYQIAQVDIAYATGTLLGATRVLWQPIAGPKP
jgi:outer membrane protein TolC